MTHKRLNQLVDELDEQDLSIARRVLGALRDSSESQALSTHSKWRPRVTSPRRSRSAQPAGAARGSRLY